MLIRAHFWTYTSRLAVLSTTRGLHDLTYQLFEIATFWRIVATVTAIWIQDWGESAHKQCAINCGKHGIIPRRPYVFTVLSIADVNRVDYEISFYEYHYDLFMNCFACPYKYVLPKKIFPLLTLYSRMFTIYRFLMCILFVY